MSILSSIKSSIAAITGDAEMANMFLSSWASKLMSVSLAFLVCVCACVLFWNLVRLQRKSVGINTREWLDKIKESPIAAAIYLVGLAACLAGIVIACIDLIAAVMA